VKSQAYGRGARRPRPRHAQQGSRRSWPRAAKLGPTALTALRMLLTTYIENAVGSAGADGPLANLAMWRSELRARGAAAPPAAAAPVKEFDAAFAPWKRWPGSSCRARTERAVELAVKRYVAAFNAKDKPRSSPARPDSDLAARPPGRLRRHCGRAVDGIFLVSAVKAALRAQRLPSPLATCFGPRAPAGARRTRLTFSLKKADNAPG